MIKGIVFDIGQTLVHYPIPLNWSSLYRPAFGKISEDLGISISDSGYEAAGRVLTRYNTRINPREKEVSSDQIFSEIISEAGLPSGMKDQIKDAFYSFFQREAYIYPEAEDALSQIKSKGIITATLSDVAYGMDNRFALADIEPLLKYLDFPWTSNDTGYRKPSPKALEKVAEAMGLSVKEVVFVGDERKDIECARSAGALPVLVNRTSDYKDYGQELQISDLLELTHFV